MSDEQEPGRNDPEVGSLGEEAARLLGALSSLAQGQGTDLGNGLGSMAGQAAETLRQVDEHLATGAPECTYCPICRVVHAVREASPEVREHLASATASLLQAAAGLLATAMADGERPARARGDGVERIDLDGAWPDDGPEDGPADGPEAPPENGPGGGPE